MPTDWNDMKERLLINERRTQNVEYYALKNGRLKRAFWDRMVQRINNQNMEQHLLVTNVTTSS